MDRRTFLKGLVATAAGVLIPASVAAEPERRVWALDRTMVAPKGGWFLETGWFDTNMPEYEKIYPVSIESISVEDPYVFPRGQWISVNGEAMEVVGPWAGGLMVARYPTINFAS